VYDPSAAPDDHTIVDGGESDTVFAWQAFGGLKYAINDRMSLGVTYKYLQTEAPKWEVDEDFFSGLSSDIRMSHLKTHTVAFIFSFKF
jgi:opacity protein-like surface antigen